MLGRRVVSSLRGTGGYAERAVAAAEALLEVPDGLPLQDALAMLADGRTALLTFRAAPPQAGETALVLAAGGGVGSLLVQLTRDAGARVVAAAGGERKLALARELGADAAVDYTRADWTAGAGPVDVVFDGVGGALGRAAFEQMRTGGRLHRIGMASGAFADIAEEEAAARGLTLVSSPRPEPEQLRAFAREAIELAATGRLRATVGQTFPLERAADAHAAIESRRTLGKTLLASGEAPAAHRGDAAPGRGRDARDGPRAGAARRGARAAADDPRIAALVTSLVDGYGIAPEDATTVPIAGSPAEAAARFQAYTEAGASWLVLGTISDDWRRQWERIGEAMALLS